MAWRRPGDKPLSEPMMARLPTHICVTRPQCLKVQGLWDGECDLDPEPFTVSLHSPNCQWPLWKGGNSHWSCDPTIVLTRGNPNLYLDQPITKGWCQPIGNHVRYHFDSPNATRLRLCCSLTRINFLWHTNFRIISWISLVSFPWNLWNVFTCTKEILWAVGYSVHVWGFANFK